MHDLEVTNCDLKLYFLSQIRYSPKGQLWYNYGMSPTVFRLKDYRFYFLSNEETRMHVHVECPEGEAKYWIEPIVSLAVYHGLNRVRLNEIERIVEKHKDEIIKKWKEHFSQR